MLGTSAGRIVSCFGFCLFRAVLTRWKIDAGPAGLGKADCDGLFCIPGAVLAFTDVVHLLADELARLCRS